MQYSYIVESNPKGDLLAGKETAAVNNSLPVSIGKIEHIAHVGTEEIVRRVIQHKDRYLFHYCGHANVDGPLLRDGIANGVHLYRLLRDFEIIFLNGCYTYQAVQSLLNVDDSQSKIKVVISTHTAVYDQSAILFAELFYKRFAEGKTVEEAFQDAFDGIAALPGRKRVRRGIKLQGHDYSYEQDMDYYEIQYSNVKFSGLKLRRFQEQEYKSVVVKMLDTLLSYVGSDVAINRRLLRQGSAFECSAALSHVKSQIFPFVQSYISELFPRDDGIPVFDQYRPDHIVKVFSKIYDVIINVQCHISLADLWDQIHSGEIKLDAIACEVLVNFIHDSKSASIRTLRTITDLLDAPFVDGVKEMVLKIEDSCAYFELDYHKDIDRLSDTVDHMSTLIGECTVLYYNFEIKSIREISYKSLRHFRHSNNVLKELSEGQDNLFPQAPYCEYRLIPFASAARIEWLTPPVDKAPVACDSIYLFKDNEEHLVISPFIIDSNCRDDGPADYCYFNAFNDNVINYTSINTRNPVPFDESDELDLYKGNLLPQIYDFISRIRKAAS